MLKQIGQSLMNRWLCDALVVIKDQQIAGCRLFQQTIDQQREEMQQSEICIVWLLPHLEQRLHQGGCTPLQREKHAVPEAMQIVIK
ncbi:hypothetical protein KDAU_73280 [Dictyobacter aurantiacus]|uniref:Uncharacterized protein n=1 Tax=Dictyobacter aurantiacus TaxID=1936993 RepID=A0A401ZSY1_9CHLR|nr:hypothetical protein KDAU_73280 [Dictyobacter aurantiacus]